MVAASGAGNIAGPDDRAALTFGAGSHQGQSAEILRFTMALKASERRFTGDLICRTSVDEAAAPLSSVSDYPVRE
jgi:hypothetical protein